MTKPQPNPAPPVCAVCNYNLSGVPPLENNKIVCPECGSLLRPKVLGQVFTRARLHRKLLTQLLIPTATSPIVSIIALFVFNILSFTSKLETAFATVLYVGTLSIAFVGVLSLIPYWIAISTSAVDHARPYPRPMKRPLIPLLALLYTLPAIALYFLLYLFAASTL